MSKGHNGANGIAAGQLRAFVQRVERIEEEIKASNDDKKEIYAEAKGNGFDVKILKRVIARRRKDPAALQEEDTITELYLAALEGRDGPSSASASETDFLG